MMLPVQSIESASPQMSGLSSKGRSLTPPARSYTNSQTYGAKSTPSLDGSVVFGTSVTRANISPRYTSSVSFHNTGTYTTAGQERVIGVSSRVDENRSEIMSERVIEHTVKVPKRVVHEEVIEKVYVVPERIQREEFIDETHVVQERIIEVAKTIIKEKLIEVPEITYVDKIVEVPQVIRQEKIIEVPKLEMRERVVEVPQIITKEKIVEVPEITYKEYDVETIVEVPELHEELKIRQIPVPQYIDKPIPEYVDIEEPYDVDRNIPVPVEATAVFEYKLPLYKSRVTKVKYPVYIPRFIEVPVAEELFQGSAVAELANNAAQISLLASMKQAVSLCEIENLAANVKHSNVTPSVNPSDLKHILREAWSRGSVKIVSQSQYRRDSKSGRSRRHSFI